MIWPENKEFAFTILDDTDNATLANIKPIYDFLTEIGILSTKSLWVYAPRDRYLDTQTILDQEYLEYMLTLKDRGFELCMHGVGSGCFNTQEIIDGYNLFFRLFSEYPRVHANHSLNPDNIYFNPKSRFTFPLNYILHYRNLLKSKPRRFSGENQKSPHFWGDINKKYIKYNRSRTFNSILTSKIDPYFPYSVSRLDKYSNLWFSSSDGHTVEEFNNLISAKNIDRLEESQGVCIVYTHFAEGFVNRKRLNTEFRKKMENLALRNGFFRPVSTTLDLIPEKKIQPLQEFMLDFKWVCDRVSKRIKYRR